MSNKGNEDLPSPVSARLGLWDIVSIIVGIVVGTAIFRSSTLVFRSVSGPATALAIWLVGGLISWCGPCATPSSPRPFHAMAETTNT